MISLHSAHFGYHHLPLWIQNYCKPADFEMKQFGGTTASLCLRLTSWPWPTGCKWPRPPVNVVGVWVLSQICPQYVLGGFTPVLRAVHLWSDRSGQMVIPGLNRLWQSQQEPTHKAKCHWSEDVWYGRYWLSHKNWNTVFLYIERVCRTIS